MSVKRFDGSNWVDVSLVKRWNGSVWVDAQSVKRWADSAWVETLDRDKILYDHGNEYSEITGGWTADCLYMNGYTGGIWYKYGDCLYSADTTDNYGNIAYQTNNKVDTTGYNYINFLVDVQTNYFDSYKNSFLAGMSDTRLTYFANNPEQDWIGRTDWTTAQAYYNLSLKYSFSGMGSKYIQCAPFSHSLSHHKIEVKIYKIWLSKS